MNQPLVLSMDLATNSDHEYLLKDGPNNTLSNGSVSSRSEDLEDLLQEVPNRQERRLVVVIEATGMAWFPVALFFKTRDVPVYRVKAQQSEEFSTFLSRHAKTDQLDADALGRLYYVIPDQLHQLWMPLRDLQALRRWCKRREMYVQQRAGEMKRLKAIIKWTLPALKNIADRFSGKKMREIMAHAIDYQWMCTDMGKERFIRWAKKRNESVSRAKLETIYEAAEDARSLDNNDDYDPRAKREEAQDIVNNMKYLDQKIAEIEEKMKEAYKEVLPEKPLHTIPGIAWKTESVIKSYLGDGSRFPNLSKAEAFLGKIPATDQSGDRDRKGTHMRNDGPPLLRKFMYLAANTARSYDPQIAKTYYDQMVNNGKLHVQAVCKCANKLLARVMRVLDDGKPYQLRDNEGNPVTRQKARELIKNNYTVPKNIRAKRRNQSG